MTVHFPRPLVLGVLSALLVVGIVGLAAGDDTPDPAENGPQTWTFDANQKTMPAAQLNHFRHASSKGLKIPCARCHHTSKGVEVEAGCGDCHAVAATEGVLDIKSATHKLCIPCHLKHNATPQTKPAPYKCAGCHKAVSTAK